MTGTKKGVVLRTLIGVTFALLTVSLGAGTPMAKEPLLLVYPNKPAVFRYDPGRYELVSSQDPQFDDLYAISNVMLWDKLDGRIPIEVYRAPQLTGFEPSPFGTNEYVVVANEFNVIIDGFSEFPRTYSNLYIRFIPYPSSSIVTVHMDSQLLDDLVVPLPSLSVSTALADGNYSDIMVKHLTWSGAAGMRIVVYSDKNNDGVYSDGKPLYSIFVQDNTVSTHETTWGAVKALYGN